LFLYNPNAIEVLVFAAISLVIILFTSFMYMKMGKTITLSPGLILNTSLEKAKSSGERVNLNHLLNQKGETLTALIPVGRAKFSGEIFDVMSDVDMIASNAKVYVHRIEGSKIYVRKEQ